MTPEGRVKIKIKAELNRLGLLYFMPAMGSFGRAGVSDFIICANGIFVAIEAKSTASKEPTELQKSFIKKVQAAGGVAWVIHAGNVVQLPQLLRNLMEEKELCK